MDEKKRIKKKTHYKNEDGDEDGAGARQTKHFRRIDIEFEHRGNLFVRFTSKNVDEFLVLVDHLPLEKKLMTF